MNESLTTEEQKLLREASEGAFASIDLRFEGGPYVGVLNGLCDRGLLRAFPDEDTAYMIGFEITDEGRAALDR